MIDFWNSLLNRAKAMPDSIALISENENITYQELIERIEIARNELRRADVSALALFSDNSPDWIMADIAALVSNIPLVPVPLFFSASQIIHAIKDSCVDAVLTDRPEQLLSLLEQSKIRAEYTEVIGGLRLIKLNDVNLKSELINRYVAKVTYTSGTTGEPKGVCLSREQIETVAQSLLEITQANANDRHLCLTPLSTLLENIAGVYVPFLAGACIHVLPLQHIGLNGAAGLDANKMLRALRKCNATSGIMVPAMLQGLVSAVKLSGKLPSSLRFLAVGGAPVSDSLLAEAELLGIPVYEGYGLSECSSVVALNSNASKKRGSVGKVLPHLSATVSAEGEIVIEGANFLGYLGEKNAERFFATGDIGYLDAEGYLFLTGRKKTSFITSFGRNISPEWIERELTFHPDILQAAVFGESRAFNIAVIFPRSGASKDEIVETFELVNKKLPDYARVKKWISAAEPFTLTNRQLTSNGRLKRDAIWSAYSHAIESIYQENLHDVL